MGLYLAWVCGSLSKAEEHEEAERERGNFSKEECARGRAYLTRHDVADLLVVDDARDHASPLR